MKPDANYPNIPTLKQASYDVAATPQIRAVVAPRAFPKDAELAKSIEQIEKDMRVQFQLAGKKLVR